MGVVDVALAGRAQASATRRHSSANCCWPWKLKRCSINELLKTTSNDLSRVPDFAHALGPEWTTEQAVDRMDVHALPHTCHGAYGNKAREPTNSVR